MRCWCARFVAGSAVATLRQALEETLKTSGLIYMVIIGALIFAAFISVTGLTDAIGSVDCQHWAWVR